MKSAGKFQTVCHVRDCDEMSPGKDKVQDKFYIINMSPDLQSFTRLQTMTFFLINFHSK